MVEVAVDVLHETFRDLGLGVWVSEFVVGFLQTFPVKGVKKERTGPPSIEISGTEQFCVTGQSAAKFLGQQARPSCCGMEAS